MLGAGGVHEAHRGEFYCVLVYWLVIVLHMEESPIAVFVVQCRTHAHKHLITGALCNDQVNGFKLKGVVV